MRSICKSMPPVVRVNGRYYRNEALEPSGKQPLTREDRQKLVQRHFETGELRQAYSDLNLLAARDLGARLRAQGEG